jgi:hypothetical protein
LLGADDIHKPQSLAATKSQSLHVDFAIGVP